MKRLISETTSLINKIADPAGTALGNAGFEPGLQEIEKARDWLADRDPKQTDQALRTSLQSQLSVELNVVCETRFPDERTFISVPKSANVSGKYENREAAIRRLELSMTPCSIEAAESLVTLMQIATASAKRSDEGQEIAFDFYVSLLRRYPADVARAACESLVMGKDGIAWMPKPAEVAKECDSLVAFRLAMLNGLKAWDESPPALEQRTRQKLLDQAYDLDYEASKMDEELLGFPKPSPDRQAELKAAMPVTRAKARELRVEARGMAR